MAAFSYHVFQWSERAAPVLESLDKQTSQNANKISKSLTPQDIVICLATFANLLAMTCG